MGKSKLTVLVINLLRVFYPRSGGGPAKERLRAAMEKLDINPPRAEAFIKLVMAEAWQGVESFRPLTGSEQILIGQRILYSIFGEGEAFNEPELLEAAGQAHFSEEDLEALKEYFWP